jgi:stringent starvation protein B
MMNAPEISSTRPYLIRALHEWCADNGFTPYLAVSVDDGVQVPREFVKNGEIVLNVSLDATSNLRLGNDFIEFKARFGGVPRDIVVPVGRVLAIYARENGQGMAFPGVEAPSASAAGPSSSSGSSGSSVSPALTSAPTPGAGASPTRVPLSVLSSPENPSETPPPSAGGSKFTLKRVK